MDGKSLTYMNLAACWRNLVVGGIHFCIMPLAVLSCLLCCSVVAHAQSVLATYEQLQSNDMAQLLVREGFENVQVRKEADVVYVAMENNVYRRSYEAIARTLLLLDAVNPPLTRYEMVMLDRQEPQVCIHAFTFEAQWTVEVDYDVRPVMQKLAHAKMMNPTTGRIDITFYPKVSIDNHRFDVLYEYAVALAPSFETTLWRGNRITLQPVIPVVTGNLYDDNRLKYLRLGIASVQQDVIAAGKWNASVAAGLFYPDYSGVHAEIDYKVSQAFDTKLQAGYVGESFADADGYHVEYWNKFTFLAKLNYYEQRTRLQAELTAGRFVYGDYGARVDVTRHFGDYAIGVFGILTGGEHNAGFHFCIPLMGKRQLRRGYVRARLPQYFDWEYNMVSNFEYADEKMGSTYKEQADKNRSAHYWQADYIKQNLTQFINSF